MALKPQPFYLCATQYNCYWMCLHSWSHSSKHAIVIGIEIQFNNFSDARLQTSSFLGTVKWQSIISHRLLLYKHYNLCTVTSLAVPSILPILLQPWFNSGILSLFYLSFRAPDIIYIITWNFYLFKHVEWFKTEIKENSMARDVAHYNRWVYKALSFS